MVEHPDAEIYASQPGLGVVLAARVLGEFGDDPHRYTDAKARKNYAGTARSPGPRARRRSCWPATPATADSATRCSNGRSARCAAHPAPRAYYQQLRARNIGHQAALRQLANRLVGILHGCLKTHTPYDEAHRLEPPPHQRRLTPEEPGMSAAMSSRVPSFCGSH